MNATHPLARLAAAESQLISTIDNATARLDAVGTSALDSALNRLRDAAHAAASRLSNAGSVVAAIAGDLVERVLGEAVGITNALAGEEQQVGPAAGEPSAPQVEPLGREV